MEVTLAVAGIEGSGRKPTAASDRLLTTPIDCGTTQIYVDRVTADSEKEALDQAQHFESIPWSVLAEKAKAPGRRTVAIVVLVVVGAALGFFGGRIVRSFTDQGVVVSLPPQAASAEADAVPGDPGQAAVVIPTTEAPESGVTPLLPQLYSEADLMAVLPEEEMRLAVMRAEWLVRDYFTVDGPSAAVGDVRSVLPVELADVELPHVGPGGVSYVEWARAFTVEPLGPAQYRVSVAFRSLVGEGSGSLARSPVRAVSVDVAVTPEGVTSVLDLPSPLAAPGSTQSPIELPAQAEAPPEVIAAALNLVADLGNDPQLVSSGLAGDEWRLVFVVTDESGHRWPVVVRE
jgi:hypothetical protein